MLPLPSHPAALPLTVPSTISAFRWSTSLCVNWLSMGTCSSSSRVRRAAPEAQRPGSSPAAPVLPDLFAGLRKPFFRCRHQGQGPCLVGQHPQVVCQLVVSREDDACRVDQNHAVAARRDQLVTAHAPVNNRHPHPHSGATRWRQAWEEAVQKPSATHPPRCPGTAAGPPAQISAAHPACLQEVAVMQGLVSAPGSSRLHLSCEVLGS